MKGELIVTGDDFGRSPGVNLAIERTHREGILSSASLMAAGPAAKDAAERARGLPELSTGLHLVLCDGHAASPPARIPDLVDESGRFPSDPGRTGLRYWRDRRRLRDQLEREMRAQLERFLELGLRLDHVDGHHHLHLHPALFDLLEPLLGEYRAGRVRLLHEDALGRVPGGRRRDDLVPGIFTALTRRARRQLARGSRTPGPDRVYGLRATGRCDAAELGRLLAGLRAPRVEIFLHPDRETPEGRREEDALRAASVRRALRASGYRLCGSHGRPRTLPS